MPRILVATSTWWPLSARLAMALNDVGFDIEAVCPVGNLLLKLRSLRAHHIYQPLSPLRSLRVAILASEPDLVVPCDDRVVGHLHELHAQAVSASADDKAIRSLIERSIGAPEGYAYAVERNKLLQMAKSEGVRTPETSPISTVADLHVWHRTHPFPWVMKVDGTWGGAGVRIVRTWEEALSAYRQLARPIATSRVLKQLVVNRDSFPLLPWLRRERAQVTVQAFVPGRPANTMVACWKGELLASIGVEVLSAQSTTGASTVVRVIDNAEMALAGTRIVRRLRSSGFCGFDFIIEEHSGQPYLIEMNARSTQLGHLQLGVGRDLPEALHARVVGGEPRVWSPVTTNDTIAFFPQAWLFAPSNPYLRSAYHDVPWKEPDLVTELLEKPWTHRSTLARLIGRYRKGPLSGEEILSPPTRPDLRRALEHHEQRPAAL